MEIFDYKIPSFDFLKFSVHRVHTNDLLRPKSTQIIKKNKMMKNFIFSGPIGWKQTVSFP